MKSLHVLGFGGNAAFSAFCAYRLLIDTQYYVTLLGFAHYILFGLGVGLIGFCLILLNNLVKPTLVKGVLITFADVGWIVSTSLIALVYHEQFFDGGVRVIFVVNFFVFLAIVFQYASLFQFLKDDQSTYDTYFEIKKQIKSTKQQFWEVLAKLRDIHQYTASVDTSHADTEKPGIGTTRYCTSGDDKKWSETVYGWNEGESISLKFNTGTKGFPFPMEKMNGGWRLLEEKSKRFVVVWFDFTSRKLGVMTPLFCFMWTVAMSKAIENMDKASLQN